MSVIVLLSSEKRRAVELTLQCCCAARLQLSPPAISTQVHGCKVGRNESCNGCAFLSRGGQAPDAKQTTAEVSSCGTRADHFCANGLYPSKPNVLILLWKDKDTQLGYSGLRHSTVWLVITNFTEGPVASTFMVCDLGMTPCSLVGDYQRFGRNLRLPYSKLSGL
jgi:hypothetical protein